jgi:biopolymer transport protein ExbD
MAVMKKEKTGGIPPISTASLPDVIFMILFFFMISTSMRDQDILVTAVLPDASEVQKLEKKQLVSYIYIGTPIASQQAQWGTAPRIQLNDSYRTTRDILDFVASEGDKLSEAERPQMTVMLKADKGTRMGIVSDVKQELRRANALKISYAANKVLAPGQGR